jgi:curli biogenesis system outer membrane secretion channel CsgG
MKRYRTFIVLVTLSFMWLNHPFDAAAAGKVRVAVTKFENKVKSPWWDKSWDIGEGLTEMLTTELFKTGRVIVLERGAISDVVGEQQLGQSGLVKNETGAQTGQMIGAQLIVRGAVTEFSERVKGASGQISTPYFGGGVGTESAYVALDIRLIDANTGQVIASASATGTAPSTGAGATVLGPQGSGVMLGGEAFFSTPIGRATRQAISKAVAFILDRTPMQETSLLVVKVDGDQVFINAGANESLRAGDIFTVYSKGEDLTDPSTGLKLGTTQRPIGTIEVTDVQEKFSVATVKSGGGMKRGDLLKPR